MNTDNNLLTVPTAYIRPPDSVVINVEPVADRTETKLVVALHVIACALMTCIIVLWLCDAYKK